MTPAQYKAVRESIGTQEEVANRLGIARTTLARRETGVLKISPEAADAMRHQKCKPWGEGIGDTSQIKLVPLTRAQIDAATKGMTKESKADILKQWREAKKCKPKGKNEH